MTQRSASSASVKPTAIKEITLQSNRVSVLGRIEQLSPKKTFESKETGELRYFVQCVLVDGAEEDDKIRVKAFQEDADKFENVREGNVYRFVLPNIRECSLKNINKQFCYNKIRTNIELRIESQSEIVPLKKLDQINEEDENSLVSFYGFVVQCCGK